MQQEQFESLTNEQSPFQLRVEDNIAIVTMDSALNNTLGVDFIEHLRDIIGAVIYQRLEGLVFISAKPNSFIQGFDWTELESKNFAQNPPQLIKFAEDAQSVMREIEHLRVPTVAAINGHCYGLGLELALACQYRVASNESNTSFAMPQVRSGLLPFAGGTQRLVQLIGLKDASPLLFSGDKINVRKALELGLIDESCAKSSLLSSALNYIQHQSKDNLIATKKLSYWKQLKNFLANTQFTRNQALERVESHFATQALDNHIATETLREILQLQDSKAGYQAERQALADLFNTEQSQVLRHLEQTSRQMKLQYQALGDVRDIKSVAILGSGFLGAGIAYISAYRANLPTRIKDINLNGIAQALSRISQLLQQEVEIGNLSSGKMRQILQRISGGERFIGKPNADFVIEAVYEDLELKQSMAQEAFAYFGKDIVYATNTSTLSIAQIAEGAPYPENLIGFHYFSPVSERKILEIIPHSKTSEHTIATAIHFAIQQGKVPLLVKDSPAFFINRILIPYLLEAVYCLIDGESIDFVDNALRQFGFELGPLEMIDDMGLDVLMKSLPELSDKFGMRFNPPEKMQLLIDNERKGAKNKRGFYLYHSQTGQRTGEDGSIYHTLEVVTTNNLEAEQIARRCLLMMINEACYCLQEQVIRNTDEGNVASVLGAFFPNFRGGIYAYIEQIGAENIVAELNILVKQYGTRFEPCPWLLNKANQTN